MSLRSRAHVVYLWQAITLAPNIATYHTALGRVLAAQGHLEAAVATVEGAIDLDSPTLKFTASLPNLIWRWDGLLMPPQLKRMQYFGKIKIALQINPNN